ncbi:hypothetical protein Cgig2_000566 [Carnegiea gigantea]|uniref:Uncharacterized protein n=1 Tax=Carnegiea gigantea TaxID=171969 RepID=A0A9Q1GUP1_9CARY|nr:hypothetical protein Cgig2_000566 [Carnegiea gigantea]
MDDGNKKQVQGKFCRKIIKGSITHLKQHLAHKTCDFVPCHEISAKVKRDTSKLLQEFKEKKKDKVRRTRDLEEELARSINRIDIDDDDNGDDDQLAFGRYQSIQQHELHHDQQVFSTTGDRFYDREGMREGSSRGKGVMAFIPLPTIVERIKSTEIDFEKDQTRTKQAKATDKNQPFVVVDSIYTNPLFNTIHEVGWDVRALSSYELIEIYLLDFQERSDHSLKEMTCNEEDDTINIEDDKDRQLGVSLPVYYSVDQDSRGLHNSGVDLSPPSSHNGSGYGGESRDRGSGGINAIGTSQSSRPSLRDINPTISDHDGRRERPRIKQPKHYLIMKTKPRGGLVIVIDYVVLMIMMVVHTIMDIIK